MTALEIAVAGCGPAGFATALLLRRDGHRVAIFERFDIPRPTGSGLIIQPTGLAVLGKLGVSDTLLEHGARINRLHGEAGTTGRVVLNVRYAALKQPDAFGVGVDRATLFQLLYDAVCAIGRRRQHPIHAPPAIERRCRAYGPLCRHPPQSCCIVR